MKEMDLWTLILLSFGLSFDDFSLAFALSLPISHKTFKVRTIYAGEMAVAFSASTVLLPLLGWLVGLAIYRHLVSFGAWVVLIVFCGVGVWVIKEAFEEEEKLGNDFLTFWMILLIGTLGSLDEAVVGIGYPFLKIPISWIIIAVLLVNTVLIFLAVILSGFAKKLNRKFTSVLSGIILIVLGISKFLEMNFKM